MIISTSPKMMSDYLRLSRSVSINDIDYLFYICGMRARVFFLVVMSLLSCSCDRNVSRLLSDVESYMSERPDSALTVLRSVPDDALRRKALRARHALLHSQMLDKNRIEVTSDSIIAPAVEYYSLHGGAEERIKTFYLRARIAQNAGDDASAMEWLTKSEKYVPNNGNLTVSGRVYAMKGHLYRGMYDYPKAMGNARTAYDYYVRDGNARSQVSALLDIAFIDLLIRDFLSADSVLDSVRTFWDEMDQGRRARWYEAKIPLARISRDAEIGSIIDECMSEIQDSSAIPWLKIADVHIAAHNLEDAQKALDEYVASHPAYSSSSAFLLRQSKVEEIRENPDAALEAYKSYLSLVEQNSMDIIQQDTRYAEERSLMTEKHDRDRNLILLIFGILLLATCLLAVAFFFIRRMKSNHKELLGQMDAIKSERDALSEMIGSGTLLDSETARLVGDRLKLLNDFLAGEVTNSLLIKNSAKKQVDGLLSTKDGFISSLTLMFAVRHPEFIAYLKMQGLSDKEIGLCCMLACGLKGQDLDKVISVKTGYNMSSAIRKKLGLKSSDTNLGLYLAGKLRSMPVSS